MLKHYTAKPEVDFIRRNKQWGQTVFREHMFNCADEWKTHILVGTEKETPKVEK
jgi:hypothetical protein